MKDSITKEKVLNHSIDKVWQAITEGEQISKWFLQADFKAEAGYNFKLSTSNEQDCEGVTGTILEADPYTLKYTWNDGTPVDTLVTWTLREEGGSTILTLVHSGISKLGEFAPKKMGDFDNGWNHCLSMLPNYLNDEVSEPAH